MKVTQRLIVISGILFAGTLAQAGAETAGLAAEAGAVVPQTGFGSILLMAFMGGLILNLMPCVLPVLMVKVFSFTQLVHHDKHRALPHALAYTGGILFTLLALASIVIALKSAGHAVGWGFQFQNPLFVMVVAGVCVTFALNLFDVFLVGTGLWRLDRVSDVFMAGEGADQLDQATGESHGLKRSFFEGILAVILATPCSAPFLATAISFAFTSNAFYILTVFTAIGLGLALPFCLIVLIPGLQRFIPKPGEWMNVFKKVLGFALLGTAAWLLWVVGRQSGVDGMAQGLVFLLAVGFASFVYGLGQRGNGRRRLALTLVSLAMIFLAGTYTLQFERVEAALEGGDIKWMAYKHEAIAKELKAGRVVFADFTADWCVTCKANEKTVIHSARVIHEVEKSKIAMFKADYTNGDDWITRELAKYGKAAVPMYLVWSPKKPDKPTVLSEILTVKDLLEAFRKAGEE